MFDAERLTQEVVAHLTYSFQDLSWSKLSTTVVQVDECILEFLRTFVENYLSNEIDGIKCLSARRFILYDIEYVLTVEAAYPPRRLVVALEPVPRLIENHEFIRHSQLIGGVGKFNEIELQFPSSLDTHMCNLRDLTARFLTVGYDWLLQFILRSVRNIDIDIGTTLYCHLRHLFETTPDVCQYIWFTLIDKEQGFYAIDENRTGEALRLLSEHRDHPLSIPSENISEFLTTALPFSEMHSRFLLQKEGCVDFDLHDSRYIDRKPGFEFSEETVFGSRATSGYALEKDGQQLLVVAFPTRLKHDVMPTLERHKNDFQALFRSQQASIRSFWAEFQCNIPKRYMPEMRKAMTGATSGIVGPSTRTPVWPTRRTLQVGLTQVFLSHSSADKKAVRRLAQDLEAAGIVVWLDEREIGIGDSISQSIQEGIARADYVAVWLTERSVGSEWVRREWGAKLNKEINERHVKVLPLLAEPCEIPALLVDKKYADFRYDYDNGLDELLASLGACRRWTQETLERYLVSHHFPEEFQTDKIFGAGHALIIESTSMDGWARVFWNLRSNRLEHWESSTCSRWYGPDPLTDRDIREVVERLVGYAN